MLRKHIHCHDCISDTVGYGLPSLLSPVTSRRRSRRQKQCDVRRAHIRTHSTAQHRCDSALQSASVELENQQVCGMVLAGAGLSPHPFSEKAARASIHRHDRRQTRTQLKGPERASRRRLGAHPRPAHAPSERVPCGTDINRLTEPAEANWRRRGTETGYKKVLSVGLRRLEASYATTCLVCFIDILPGAPWCSHP